MHYYGVNLLDVFDDDSGMTPLVVFSWIRRLPPGSATMAAMNNNPESVGWGVAEYILASVVDAVNADTYVLTAANSKKKPKPPQPFYRPGKSKKAKEDNLFTQMFRKHRDAVRRAKKE